MPTGAAKALKFHHAMLGPLHPCPVPQVPEVVASLDSREFEVLVEVITMLQSPGPTVETVGAEASLLAGARGAPGMGWQLAGWRAGWCRGSAGVVV